MKQTIEVNDVMDVHVVYTNTDLTEGKGTEYPIHVCKNPVTANRLAYNNYVQGSTCPIHKMKIYRIDNAWYGPVEIRYPTSNDVEKEKIYIEKEKIREKLRLAGISEEELKLLER